MSNRCNHFSKALSKYVITSCCALGVSFAVVANIKVSDTASASFHFGGTVAASCKVRSVASADANNLTLAADSSAQDIGSLEVWCNTGNNASTQYTSANRGFLVNGDSKIAYTLAVGDGNEISLANDYVNSNTQAGFGDDGNSESHKLTITPQATGLDDAGAYSDTITVTVTYN